MAATAEASVKEAGTVQRDGNGGEMVVNSVGLLGTGGYQIEDDTGKIYAVSRSGIPSRGSRVTVKGTVMPGAQVLGQSVGVTIREQSHHMR